MHTVSSTTIEVFLAGSDVCQLSSVVTDLRCELTDRCQLLSRSRPCFSRAEGFRTDTGGIWIGYAGGVEATRSLRVGYHYYTSEKVPQIL